MATDNFNRANESPMAGNWTNVQGEFDLVSNAAQPQSLAVDSGARYNAITWPDDHYSQAKLTINNTGGGGVGIGLLVRCSTSAVTFYRLAIDHAGASNMEIGRTVASAFTSLSVQTAGAWTDGDTWKFTASGTGATVTLQVYKNGVQVGTDVTDSSANRLLTGQGGIFYSSAATSASLDDWDGGSLATNKWILGP